MIDDLPTPNPDNTRIIAEFLDTLTEVLPARVQEAHNALHGQLERHPEDNPLDLLYTIMRYGEATRLAGIWYTDGIRDAMYVERANRLYDQITRALATHQARRGSNVEAWIKARRDEVQPAAAARQRGSYRIDLAYGVLDDLLDDYRNHADTGTSLDREVQGPHASADAPTGTEVTDPDQLPQRPGGLAMPTWDDDPTPYRITGAPVPADDPDNLWYDTAKRIPCALRGEIHDPHGDCPGIDDLDLPGPGTAHWRQASAAGYFIGIATTDAAAGDPVRIRVGPTTISATASADILHGQAVKPSGSGTIAPLGTAPPANRDVIETADQPAADEGLRYSDLMASARASAMASAQPGDTITVRFGALEQTWTLGRDGKLTHKSTALRNDRRGRQAEATGDEPQRYDGEAEPVAVTNVELRRFIDKAGVNDNASANGLVTIVRHLLNEAYRAGQRSVQGYRQEVGND